MSWKNALLRGLIRSTGAKKRIKERPERILVVATTALGDTLWATPALEALRASFPESYIAALTAPIGREVLQNHPAVNRLLLWENPWSLRKVLAQEAFDTALIFHASQRMPLPLTAWSGVGTIVGTKGLSKGLDDLLTVGLKIEKEHEVVRRLKMVEAIGGQRGDVGLSFHLAPEERVAAWEEGPWVALHPGAKDSYKLWPARYFAEVGNALKRAGCQILVTGTKQERALMENVAQQVPGSRMLDEGLSLRKFAARLNTMDLVICNDTGTFHLACALKRPVIGIYSPTHPELCGPYKAPLAHVIARPPTCMPCLKRSCRLPFCLLQITPQAVVEKAVHLLSNGPVLVQ